MKENSMMLGMMMLLLGFLSPNFAHTETTNWPDIAPFETSVYFTDATKAEAWFKVLSPRGDPLYFLQCYNWRNTHDADFDYSGDFECRLTSFYSKDAFSTLLTDNPKQSRDWQSRARVLAEELVGKCADYPEYGRVRHFRLRNMELTFAFDEVGFRDFQSPDGRKVKRREFHSFRFTLRVERNSTALSEIAEPVPFSRPSYAHPEDPQDFSLSCDEVRRIK